MGEGTGLAVGDAAGAAVGVGGCRVAVGGNGVAVAGMAVGGTEVLVGAFRVGSGVGDGGITGSAGAGVDVAAAVVGEGAGVVPATAGPDVAADPTGRKLPAPINGTSIASIRRTSAPTAHGTAEGHLVRPRRGPAVGSARIASVPPAAPRCRPITTDTGRSVLVN